MSSDRSASATGGPSFCALLFYEDRLRDVDSAAAVCTAVLPSSLDFLVSRGHNGSYVVEWCDTTGICLNCILYFRRTHPIEKYI